MPPPVPVRPKPSVRGQSASRARSTGVKKALRRLDRNLVGSVSATDVASVTATSVVGAGDAADMASVVPTSVVESTLSPTLPEINKAVTYHNHGRIILPRASATRMWLPMRLMLQQQRN